MFCELCKIPILVFCSCAQQWDRFRWFGVSRVGWHENCLFYFIALWLWIVRGQANSRIWTIASSFPCHTTGSKVSSLLLQYLAILTPVTLFISMPDRASSQQYLLWWAHNLLVNLALIDNNEILRRLICKTKLGDSLRSDYGTDYGLFTIGAWPDPTAELGWPGCVWPTVHNVHRIQCVHGVYCAHEVHSVLEPFCSHHSQPFWCWQ